jgi:hypothetical protein
VTPPSTIDVNEKSNQFEAISHSPIYQNERNLQESSSRSPDHGINNNNLVFTAKKNWPPLTEATS